SICRCSSTSSPRRSPTASYPHDRPTGSRRPCVPTTHGPTRRTWSSKRCAKLSTPPGAWERVVGSSRPQTHLGVPTPVTEHSCAAMSASRSATSSPSTSKRAAVPSGAATTTCCGTTSPSWSGSSAKSLAEQLHLVVEGLLDRRPGGSLDLLADEGHRAGQVP